MKHFRKQFEGQWKVVSLNDEEVAKIEEQARDYIYRIRQLMYVRKDETFHPFASEERSTILPSFLDAYNDQASDYIEAKYKAYQAAKLAKQAAATPPTATS
jgi:hypothetical protein